MEANNLSSFEHIKKFRVFLVILKTLKDWIIHMYEILEAKQEFVKIK